MITGIRYHAYIEEATPWMDAYVVVDAFPVSDDGTEITMNYPHGAAFIDYDKVSVELLTAIRAAMEANDKTDATYRNIDGYLSMTIAAHQSLMERRQRLVDRLTALDSIPAPLLAEKVAA